MCVYGARCGLARGVYTNESSPLLTNRLHYSRLYTTQRPLGRASLVSRLAKMVHMEPRLSRIEQPVESRIYLATQPRIARLVELFLSQQRHLGLERLQLRLTL